MFPAGFHLLSISACLLSSAVGSRADSPKTIPHSVQLSHPAVNASRPQAYTLCRETDGDGLPIGYAMAVSSVICRKKTCEILKGWMWWDEIGRFQRYEFPPGKDLTKKDHKPFTPEEYAKLGRLLRNPNSPLRDYAYEKLTAPESWDDVDAITGATANEIKAEVVDGAGYTCYTLWHWANGDVVKEIQRLTAATLNTALACRLLSSDDEERVLFALRNLESLKLYDDPVIRAVREGLAGARSTQLLFSLRYLGSAAEAPAVFHKETATLFWKLPHRERQTLLDFMESQPAVSPVFFDTLIKDLPTLTEYYELHRILALVEKSRYRSKQVNARVTALLTNRNFFIARRAYWFLEKRELAKDQRRAVREFFEEHGDRL